MSTDPSVRPLRFPPEFRHLWLFSVACALLNAVLLWFQFRKRRVERPELAARYQQYFLGYVVAMTLPWLVMGFGIEIGGVPQPFSYLRPAAGSPYIVAFNAVITVEHALLCAWVFLYRGDKFLLSHPGTLGRSHPTTATKIRVSFAFMLVGWIAVLVLRHLNILPTPPIQ